MRQASPDQDVCRPAWPRPASAAELIWGVAPLITSSASVVYLNSACSARSFTRRGFCLLIRERRNVQACVNRHHRFWIGSGELRTFFAFLVQANVFSAAAIAVHILLRHHGT